MYNEGSSYDPSVLNMTDDDLVGKFQSGLATITAVSLGAGYPTILSLPHTFVNCYKNVVAVALGLEDYSFPAADKIKAILAVRLDTRGFRGDLGGMFWKWRVGETRCGEVVCGFLERMRTGGAGSIGGGWGWKKLAGVGG